MNFNFWKKDKKKDTSDPKKGNPAPIEYGIQQTPPTERIEPVHTDAPDVPEDQNGNDMFMGMDMTSQSDPREDGGQSGNGDTDLLSNILTTPASKTDNEDTSSEESHSKFDFISTTEESTSTSFDPSKFLSSEPTVQVPVDQPSILYVEKNTLYPEKKPSLYSTDSTKIDQAKPVQRMNSINRIQPPAVKKKKKLVGEKAIGFEAKITEESSTPDNLTEESTSDGIITPTASLDPNEESMSKLGGTEKKWFAKLPEHISTNSNNLGATNEQLTELESDNNSTLYTEHKVDKFDAIKNMIKDSKYNVFTSDELHKSDKEQVVVDGGKSELVVAVAEETKPKIEVQSEQIPKIEKNIEKINVETKLKPKTEMEMEKEKVIESPIAKKEKINVEEKLNQEKSKEDKPKENKEVPMTKKATIEKPKEVKPLTIEAQLQVIQKRIENNLDSFKEQKKKLTEKQRELIDGRKKINTKLKEFAQQKIDNEKKQQDATDRDQYQLAEELDVQIKKNFH